MYEAIRRRLDERYDETRLAAEFEQRQRAGIDVVYGAWLDGELAGHARAMFSPRGVYLTGGSTAPSARGRGVYRALVRARWDDAVARGTPALAVSAGAMSSPILQRRGFEKVVADSVVSRTSSASPNLMSVTSPSRASNTLLQGSETALPHSVSGSSNSVLQGAMGESCLRCGAEMEWRQSTWQCPRCRFKLGCCEGEAGDCRDPG